jgi:hypothetical protein
MIKSNDHVFGYVLEVLTTGLYPNNLDIIREYIQNGYDAINSLKELGIRGSEEIHIIIENGSITIHDTGIGMDRDTVEKYKYFGYSEKITTKSSGFRGIGKLAGLSVAKDLEVVTSKYGVPYQYRVRFSASKMLNKILIGKRSGVNYPLNELIQEFTFIDEAPEEINNHYTKVILHEIKEDAFDLLNEEIVEKHISQVMPIEFHKTKFHVGHIIEEKLLENVPGYKQIEIFLNHKKIYKPYVTSDNLSGLKFIPVYDNENKNLIAYAWIMKNGNNSSAIVNDNIKNIRTFFKGFMIGNKELLNSVLFSSGRQFLSSWFAGEIYVLDEDLIPTSARDQFESNTARSKLFEQLREQIGKTLDKLANDTSKKNSLKKEIDKANNLIQKIQKINIESTPKELIKQKENEVEFQIKAIKKKLTSQDNLTSETNKKANQIIEELLNQKETIVTTINKVNFHQIELDLSPREKQLYEIMIKSIKTYFKKNKIENEDELISHVYTKIRNTFGTKSSS